MPRRGNQMLLVQLILFPTIRSYLSSPSSFLSLTSPAQRKLQMLTIVSACNESFSIDLEKLGRLVGLENERFALEEIIVEAMSKKLLKGQIDHESGRFGVQRVILGRDLRRASDSASSVTTSQDLDYMETTLTAYNERLAELMRNLDSLSKRAAPGNSAIAA